MDVRECSQARTELQAWYLGSLGPKLARAADAGIVRSAVADSLDRELRTFLDLPLESDSYEEAA
jgi:hypothetical protein